MRTPATSNEVSQDQSIIFFEHQKLIKSQANRKGPFETISSSSDNSDLNKILQDDVVKNRDECYSPVIIDLDEEEEEDYIESLVKSFYHKMDDKPHNMKMDIEQEILTREAQIVVIIEDDQEKRESEVEDGLSKHSTIMVDETEDDFDSQKDLRNLPTSTTQKHRKVHRIQSDPGRPTLWLNKLQHYSLDSSLGNTISFRELLFEDLLFGDPDYPARTLESAFLTSFGYNIDLIKPLLIAGVKVTLACEYSDNHEIGIEHNYKGYFNLTLVRPYKDKSRPGSGVFHPKLYILKFPDLLRVVIGSGNLGIPHWTDYSNCLWFRDFPLKSLAEMNGTQENSDEPNEFDFDADFEETLEHFIVRILPESVNYSELLGFSLNDYYIKDVDIVLIPSIPGRHHGKYFDKYGHRRIASVLKRTLESSKEVYTRKHVITYQTTSMSSLDENFLSHFLSSILPDFSTIEGLKVLQGLEEENDIKREHVRDRLRLIYPTKRHIDNCKDSKNISKPLMLNNELYEKLPRDIFYQFEPPSEDSIHSGLIPHLKVFIITDESGKIDDNTIIYFGSHNLSPGAWGRYDKEYSQIIIGNTELGVLLPPKKGSGDRKERLVNSLSFKFPPRRYEGLDNPWISQSNHQIPVIDSNIIKLLTNELQI